MPKSFSLSPAAAALTVLIVASAMALRGVAPWFYWVAMVAVPAGVLLFTELEFLRSNRGRRILYICAALLVVHVLWAFVRIQFYSAAVPDTYWLDDHNYYKEATAIASAWASGNFPEIWRKGELPYLGSLHTGYHRPVSALFLLFGPSTVVGLLLNAVCAATFPLLTALSARYLWEYPAVQPSTRRDPVLVTAVLTALHPTQFYWASYVLKDVFVAFVFLVSLVLLLGAWHRRSISYGVASVIVLPFLFSVRMYTAITLAAGAVCVPLLRMRGRHVVAVFGALFAFVYMICAYTLSGFHLYKQMRDSIAALSPGGAGSPADILKQIGAGIPRLFLAPYGWILLAKPTPMYGLYPGMWYLYLLGYPLAFSGFYLALRRNISSAIIPIAVFGLSSLLFLTSAYEGNASRQRFYLEYVILIFAGYGFCRPNKWWIGGILAAEAAFAIGQVIALQ